MTLPVDVERLLAAVGAALATNVLPHLQDADARMHAEAALGLIARNVMALSKDTPAYESQAASRLTDLRTLLQRPPGMSGAGEETTRELLSLLESDDVWHRRFQQLEVAAAEQLRSGGQASFRAPSEEELTACIRMRFPADTGAHARNVRALHGGGSKQTVMFDKVADDGGVEPFVMRRDFPDPYFGNTVRDEYPVIVALHARGFQAPEPVWLDASCACLPQPFMVTRRILARPAGGPRGANPAVVADPIALMAQLFSKLHEIDPARLGVERWKNATADERYVRTTIEAWESRYLAVIKTPAAPVLLAFAWLRVHAAVGAQQPAVVHGDAGFHNIVIDEHGRPTLLDWEFVHVGAAAEDLCYARGQLQPHGPFEKFLDTYESLGGRRPAMETLEFYEIFRLARGATMFAARVAEFNQGSTDQMPGVNGAAYLYAGFVKQLSKRLQPMLSARRWIS